MPNENKYRDQSIRGDLDVETNPPWLLQYMWLISSVSLFTLLLSKQKKAGNQAMVWKISTTSRSSVHQQVEMNERNQ